MSTFVLSSLLNLGIGLCFGFLIWIIGVIASGGLTAASIGGTLWSSALFFSLLTMNMYRIYFFYTISLDVNAVCEGDGDENESFLVAAILSVLTLGIYQLFWMYKIAKRLRNNAPRYGFKMVPTGKDIVVLNILSFGFVGSWELIKSTNSIAKVYNQNGLGGVQ